MLTPVVAVLRAEGRNVDAVLAAGDVREAALQDPTHRVTLRAATLIWRAALREVRDPGFGLRAARLTEAGDFDLLLCLARSCTTLEHALRLGVQYASLLDESLMCSLRVRDAGCVLSLGPRSAQYLPEVAEYVLARLVLLGRQLLGPTHVPLEVRFAHNKPKTLQLHRELFRAPVRFGCDQVALVFERAALEQPMPAPDPVLQRVLEPYAQRLLAGITPRSRMAHRVRDAVLELLPAGIPSRTLVARRLGVGARTLARWLEDEGTTFSALVDDLRVDLALRRLEEPDVALGDIASELGFSDQSAFTKSFKRWVGMTPSEYRRKGRAQPS